MGSKDYVQMEKDCICVSQFTRSQFHLKSQATKDAQSRPPVGGAPLGDKHTHTAEGQHGNPAHAQLSGQA